MAELLSACAIEKIEQWKMSVNIFTAAAVVQQGQVTTIYTGTNCYLIL